MTRDELRSFIETTTGAEPWQVDAILVAADTYAWTRHAYTLAEDPPPDRRGRYWPTPKADRELAAWDRYYEQAGR